MGIKTQSRSNRGAGPARDPLTPGSESADTRRVNPARRPSQTSGRTAAVGTWFEDLPADAALSTCRDGRDVPVHARRLAVQVGDVRIEDDARGRVVLLSVTGPDNYDDLSITLAGYYQAGRNAAARA